MGRLWTALLTCTIALAPGLVEAPSVSAEPLAATAVDARKKPPKPVKGKVCPARNFWVGSGWGDDRGHRTHRGIDLGGRRGSPLYAVERGRIVDAKKQPNKAYMMVLKGKSGSKYYYGHMDRLIVRKGQKVRRGQIIGRMGDSGSPGAVHLHFEYWKSGRNSDAINPERFIKRICRLKK
jgi:murein DD-endopeptidase MepM/ murein hydrolase activator NlpD